MARLARAADVAWLVINADDFGIAPGVNRGIIEAHRAGVVTSTSLLATGAAFDDAVARAHAVAPTLGIGVHLDFVQGCPVAPATHVASLVDPSTGAFRPLAALTRRALAGRIDPADVVTEASAQIARVRAAGFDVTHVDSHRHTHALPGIWTAVVAATRAAGIYVIRTPREHITPQGGVRAALKALALRGALSLATRSRATPADSPPGLWSPDAFVGLALQGVGPRLLSRLVSTLDVLRPGAITELMVHPGYVDADLTRDDPYTRAREAELAALLSATVRARLRDGAIHPIHFGAIWQMKTA